MIDEEMTETAETTRRPMRKIAAAVAAGALMFGLAACGGNDAEESTKDDAADVSDEASDDTAVDDGADDMGGEDTSGEDETFEADQGSNEALTNLEGTIAGGIDADYAETYGASDVSCPPEIAEGPGVYECDVTFEDGSTAIATVSTEGGSIDLQGVEFTEA